MAVEIVGGLFRFSRSSDRQGDTFSRMELGTTRFIKQKLQKMDKDQKEPIVPNWYDMISNNIAPYTSVSHLHCAWLRLQTKMASNMIYKIIATFSLLSVALAGKRTLVLVDNWSIRESHSIFFKNLRGNFCSLWKCIGTGSDFGYCPARLDTSHTIFFWPLLPLIPSSSSDR